MRFIRYFGLNHGYLRLKLSFFLQLLLIGTPFWLILKRCIAKQLAKDISFIQIFLSF